MSTGGLRYGYDDYDDDMMPPFPTSVSPVPGMEPAAVPDFPVQTVGTGVPVPDFPEETEELAAARTFPVETAAAAAAAPSFPTKTARAAPGAAYPVEAGGAAVDAPPSPVGTAEAEAAASIPDPAITANTTGTTPITTISPVAVLREMVFWRDKKLSLAVLAVATASWVVFQVLEFNFLPVVCWLGIATLTPLFVWANLAPLFRMEPPQLFNWEVSAQSVIEKVNALRLQIEESSNWLLRKMVQRDWRVFLQAMAALLLLSWLGSTFDFLTLVYFGLVMALTVTPLYTKNEERIKTSMDKAKEKGREYEERIRLSLGQAKEKGRKYEESMKGSMDKAREQGRRYRDMFDTNVWNKMGRKKVVVKEKKTE